MLSLHQMVPAVFHCAKSSVWWTIWGHGQTDTQWIPFYQQGKLTLTSCPCVWIHYYCTGESESLSRRVHPARRHDGRWVSVIFLAAGFGGLLSMFEVYPIWDLHDLGKVSPRPPTWIPMLIYGTIINMVLPPRFPHKKSHKKLIYRKTQQKKWNSAITFYQLKMKWMNEAFDCSIKH